MEQSDNEGPEITNLQDWLDSLIVPSDENEKAHIQHMCNGLLTCYYCRIEASVSSVTWEWDFNNGRS